VENLEDDALQFLLLHAPMKRDDAVNVVGLLETIVTSEETFVSQAKMMDLLVGYFAGEFNAELAESRLSTPSNSSGRAASKSLRFTPRSAGRSSVALSAMTEEMEEDFMGSATERTNSGGFEEVGFSSRLEDDELTAETSYDPAQAQFLLTRVNDLTSGLVNVNRRINSLSIDRDTLSSGLGKVELEVESLQDEWERKRARWSTEVTGFEGKVAAASTRVEESIRTQRVLNEEVEGRLERLEEPFQSATGFPALFTKVGELATTVNGAVDGPPGAGIEEFFKRKAERTAGGSFGLNLGAGGGVGSRDPRVSELEREVQGLRSLVSALTERVNLIGATPTPADGVAGLGSANIYDRLDALEQRTQAGHSVTISEVVFNNERDVARFVTTHVPNPNFGIVCDLVILLQTLKVGNPTTESTAGLLAQAQKVNMDPLETAIVGSYGVELPTIFDRTQGALTSSNLHPLPSAKAYSDWSNASTGLRDKVNAELKNSVISARKRIADAKMSPTAVMVFRDLVNNSSAQWTSLSAFMDQQVAIMMGQYGLEEAEAWLLVGKTVRQIFVKLRERRVSGENVITALTSKQDQFVSILWASLQGHALMAEYQRDEYYGHHSLAAITAEHMLKHRVSPKEFASVKDRVVSVVATLEGVGTDLDRCLDKAGLQPVRKKKRTGG